MDLQGKIWGSTSLLFLNDSCELHRLVGTKGGFSSKHKHDKKWNLLFIESGCIVVRRWKEYGLVDRTVLEPQQSIRIPPGEYHQFEVIDEGSVIYELYWVALESEDIVREGHGGLRGATDDAD